MKIAILGYGKMGKEIEAIALERGHTISGKISSQNMETMAAVLGGTDVAIEFSKPDSAVHNMNQCFAAQVPIVVGTTGWNEQISAQVKHCKDAGGALLHASNFSLGVNIFFEVNRKLARIMNSQPAYEAHIEETHHTEKLDAPSGTAITLANGIIEEIAAKKGWVNQKAEMVEELSVISKREPGVPGTHEIFYRSAHDEITLKHTAFSRKGFALGAVLAAEFLAGKTGVFTMQNVLNIESEHVT